MTKTQVLVLQEKTKLCGDLGNLSLAVPTIEIAGVVDNLKDAELILEKFSIDAIVIELSNLTDGNFQFIEDLSLRQSKLVIAVFTPMQDDIAVAKLRRKGCTLIFRVPCDCEEAAEEIQHAVVMHKKTSMPVSVRLPQEKPLDERLANIFIASGIPPHIKGYQFLREAVKLAVHTPSMINNITKQLYPSVAIHYDTTPSKVERAIRHAIDVAWSRGKIDNINSIYGIKVFSKGERPTNGELIALISDKIIIEGIS